MWKGEGGGGVISFRSLVFCGRSISQANYRSDYESSVLHTVPERNNTPPHHSSQEREIRGSLEREMLESLEREMLESLEREMFESLERETRESLEREIR